jgi:hypothetical protein
MGRIKFPLVQKTPVRSPLAAFYVKRTSSSASHLTINALTALMIHCHSTPGHKNGFASYLVSPVIMPWKVGVRG